MAGDDDDRDDGVIGMVCCCVCLLIMALELSLDILLSANVLSLHYIQTMIQPVFLQLCRFLELLFKLLPTRPTI